MIKYKKGNILSETTEALVNTVNCVGVMGRGIALQFKKSYPENYKAYKAACDQEKVEPGKMFVYQIGFLTDPKYIINFPTKRHWRGKSRMEDIKSGLQALAQEIQNRNIQSISIPPLGCGLGGLNWQEVRREIEETLSNLQDVTIVVFEPNEKITPRDIKPSKKVPKMTPGRAALIGLMNSYLRGLMDPFITLLEIHKLMYFMQEAGEPLKLQFKKGKYGPYAENLRHVLNHVEGHYISGYADGGDIPEKQITLIPGSVKDAQNFLSNENETVKRFDQVVSLVDGFETPFGLELLATVHWVVTSEKKKNINDVVQAVYNWNERKKQFSERQINIAYERLTKQDWFNDN